MADGGTLDGGQRKKRGGSNRRQRTRLTAHRWLDEEFNAVAGKASDAGLSFGAFIRACALGDAGPRAQRRPPIEKDLLIRLLGQVGRVGNNINQIAHGINAGDPCDLPELRRALKEFMGLRDAIYEALGKSPAGDVLFAKPGPVHSTFLPPGGPSPENKGA